MRIRKKPKNPRSLNGRVITLSRFISKATDKCVPFFDQVKKGQNFEWNEKCEIAFENLKDYLVSTPILSKLVTCENLYIDLVVTDQAISVAMVREDEGTQMLI